MQLTLHTMASTSIFAAAIPVGATAATFILFNNAQRYTYRGPPMMYA